MNNLATQYGGGINQQGTRLILINSTISGNQAQSTGGIHSDKGDVQLYNSTITHNSSSHMTGGIYVRFGPAIIQNSMIAENTPGSSPDATPDCRGAFTSSGYNLIGDTTGCTFNAAPGDLLDVKPLIIPIQTYYALLPGSPAIDAGNPEGCLDNLGNPITDDQRGTPRPLDGDSDGIAVCDIGAYEYDPDHPVLLGFLPLCSKPCPILFFDDFSNPNSGWPVGNNNVNLLEYNNGEYRILMHLGQNIGLAISPVSAENFKVSVDLRNATGVYGSYGIMFGYSENQGWYTFEIYTDGWYGIYRYDIWGGLILAEAYSPYIHQGMVSNQISVVRNGTSITVYANGNLLTTASDNRFTSTRRLGLVNYAYSQPDVDVRYDNFRVDPVDCPKTEFENGITGYMPGWFVNEDNGGLPPINFNKHQP